MKNCMIRLAFIPILCLFLLFFSKNASAIFFESEGVKIYYTDSKGDGDPIVLVHGYTMNSAMWHDAGIVQKLSKNHRVITLDCRGHGKSGKPESPTEYGPKVGKDIINLLDYLEIPKAHMVGYSMGAFVVGRLLVTSPKRMLSATLGSGFFPTTDKEEKLFQEKTAIDMENHGEPVFAAIARGWRYDAVTDTQISEITVPVQAVFGSKEIDDFYESQKERLRMPKSALPIVIIKGADHDSNKAAVLHPKFLEAVKNIISFHKESR